MNFLLLSPLSPRGKATKKTRCFRASLDFALGVKSIRGPSPSHPSPSSLPVGDRGTADASRIDADLQAHASPFLGGLPPR